MPEYKVRADTHFHLNLFEYQLMCGDKRTLKKAIKMAKAFARRERNAMRKADVESFAFGGDFRRDKQDLPKFTLGQKVQLSWASWMHSAKEPPLSIGGKKGKRRPERRACAAPPLPPRLRRELAAQTIRYGTFEGVIVDPNVAGSAATARLPVVLLLQGSGGFWPKTKKKFGKDADINSLDIPLNCPKHCWYAYMQITGKNNRKLPDELMQFIRELHGMCKHEGNPIVAMGFSRGARWLEEIVRENSHYLEVAIIIAGYPENKDKVQNKSHAQELVKVKSTIVCMVHFISDFHCNTSIYPDWYGEFERASEPSVREIEDITSFNNFMLQGNHKDAEELWYNWHFAKVDDELNGWFEAMWENLESNQI